ncbi:MAG: ATP-grasp domain-containing protein [Candidatus Omnitrophota bacterium]
MTFNNKPQNKILITISKEKSIRNDIREVLNCKNSIEKVFLKKGIKTEIFFIKEEDFKDAGRLKTEILSTKAFCVFNLFEGFSNDCEKEAAFVRMLENIRMPFTGNTYFTLRVCLNKSKTKDILKKNNLPVARGIVVKNVKNIKVKELVFPVFVKPCSEDASVGIYKDSLVFNKEELFDVVKKRLRFFSGGLIVEEFLPGKEYSVAFLGNKNYKILGISEINYSKHEGFASFLTYDAKWSRKTLDYRATMPDYKPKINNTLRDKIIDLSTKAAQALGCRGYFRVDLRGKSGNLFIIDINPNPDINRDSGYMKLAYGSGYTYEATIEKILRLANTEHFPKCKGIFV